MHLVRKPLTASHTELPRVGIRVDRQTISKRLWRASAEDGTDFGFDLEEPLHHGDIVFESDDRLYVIEQNPEPVLRIPIDVSPEEAAVIGWAVGNMHFTIQACGDHILAPDDPGLRQMLNRIGIVYTSDRAVFRPHRFASVVVHSHDPAPGHPFIRPPTHGHSHAHVHDHG